MTPPATSTDPPILTPVSVTQKPGSAPLFPWMFSRQKLGFKLQAACASMLVLVTGGITIQDRLTSSARDAAYQQILWAERRQDHLGVVQGSEAFFANAPLSGKDGRNQQIMDLYTESLVHWIAQQGDQLDASTQFHLNRYRTVTETVKPQGK